MLSSPTRIVLIIIILCTIFCKETTSLSVKLCCLCIFYKSFPVLSCDDMRFELWICNSHLKVI